MKVFPMLLVLATAVFVSCERHEWNETKKLSEPHHGHGAHAGGHDEHAAGDGHKHDDGHGHAEGEKKAGH